MAEKPTRSELEAARAKVVPDVIGPGLQVLFCGINPGLYSAATGHHFARPGNRFWKALHLSGFTAELLPPARERELLEYGIGITNLVSRTTAAASELGVEELVRGRAVLVRKVRRYRPRVLAVLGVSAYRSAFAAPAEELGECAERMGDTRVWVLPNPSGLNAHYQLPELAALFAELRRKLGQPR